MMCNHAAPILVDLLTKKAPPQGTEAEKQGQGSRRRKLWELPTHTHCAVVGVCLPLGVLRKIMIKLMPESTTWHDYAVHSQAVSSCRSRNVLSEALHKAMEARHDDVSQAFRKAKIAQHLLRLWLEAVDMGDVSSALWASLTHPRCDLELENIISHDIHMLQHQAGASRRIDVAKLDALLAENAVLARELARVQERSTRHAAEYAQGQELAKTQLAQLQTTIVANDRQLIFLQAELVQLRSNLPDLENRQRLQQRLKQSLLRQHKLEEDNVALRRELTLSDAKAAPTPLVEAANSTQPPTTATRTIEPVRFFLKQKNVLCVGGRTGNVASYRDLIEQVGGQFAHHDGGMEDSHALLESNLAAADLVICQTGCISHNAYWRVKDFCRRTGKRCVFVESASTSALARSLNNIAAEVSPDIVVEK